MNPSDVRDLRVRGILRVFGAVQDDATAARLDLDDVGPGMGLDDHAVFRGGHERNRQIDRRLGQVERNTTPCDEPEDRRTEDPEQQDPQKQAANQDSSNH
jgi:hypothetical protein